MANTALYDIHASLCHPGVTRFHHYIKTKNLPFNLQEVRDTVARCLNELFTTFELRSYIHSDRGKCFTSQNFISYLNKRGVSTSYTSVYNPQGNGQCKRYNAIIWMAVKLSLKTRNLPIE